MILQGGVKINRKRISDWKTQIEIKKGIVIQVGKRRFVKIKQGSFVSPTFNEPFLFSFYIIYCVFVFNQAAFFEVNSLSLKKFTARPLISKYEHKSKKFLRFFRIGSKKIEEMQNKFNDISKQIDEHRTYSIKFNEYFSSFA